MNRYKALQQSMQASDALKKRTLDAARELGDGKIGAPVRRPKPWFVRVCALACALGIALGVAHLMGRKEDAASPVTALAGTFGFVAYAAHSGEALPAQDSRVAFDSGSGQASEDNGMYTGSLFRVTGENIASVRMEMSKGGIYRQKRVVRDHLTAEDYEALENGQMPSVEGADDCMMSSPDEKTYFLDAVWKLGADATETYDAGALYGFFIPAADYRQLGAAAGEDLQASWHESIDYFDGAALTITVTFTDGTVQKKMVQLKSGKLKAYWPVEGDGARALPELIENEGDPYLYGIYAEVA